MELVKSAFIGGVLHDLNEALGFEGFEVRESFPLRGYKIVPVCYPHAFMESANLLLTERSAEASAQS